MTGHFDPAARSVLIPVEVVGPDGGFTFRFALDTGSTQSGIRATSLERLGYDLSRPVGRKRIRSATGTAVVPLYRVLGVRVLGQLRTDFVLAAHDLPPAVTADGLLGLDFFRGLVLTLDFARGLAALRPRRWWRFWN